LQEKRSLREGENQPQARRRAVSGKEKIKPRGRRRAASGKEKSSLSEGDYQPQGRKERPQGRRRAGSGRQKSSIREREKQLMKKAV
jgi:hypothetical protein